MRPTRTAGTHVGTAVRREDRGSRNGRARPGPRGTASTSRAGGAVPAPATSPRSRRSSSTATSHSAAPGAPSNQAGAVGPMPKRRTPRQPGTAARRRRSERRGGIVGVHDHHAHEPLGRHADRVEHVRVVAAVRTVGLHEHGAVDARPRPRSPRTPRRSPGAPGTTAIPRPTAATGSARRSGATTCTCVSTIKSRRVPCPSGRARSRPAGWSARAVASWRRRPPACGRR